MKTTLRLTIAAVVLTAILTPTAASAGPSPKVNVCHVSGQGVYSLLSVNANAYLAHVNHGDAAPGDPIPGVSDFVFDGACQPEAIEAETDYTITKRLNHCTSLVSPFPLNPFYNDIAALFEVEDLGFAPGSGVTFASVDSFSFNGQLLDSQPIPGFDVAFAFHENVGPIEACAPGATGVMTGILSNGESFTVTFTMPGTITKPLDVCVVAPSPFPLNPFYAEISAAVSLAELGLAGPGLTFASVDSFSFNGQLLDNQPIPGFDVAFAWHENVGTIEACAPGATGLMTGTLSNGEPFTVTFTMPGES